MKIKTERIPTCIVDDTSPPGPTRTCSIRGISWRSLYLTPSARRRTQARQHVQTVADPGRLRHVRRAALCGEVAYRVLGRSWYQKWFVHRRHKNDSDGAQNSEVIVPSIELRDPASSESCGEPVVNFDCVASR